MSSFYASPVSTSSAFPPPRPTPVANSVGGSGLDKSLMSHQDVEVTQPPEDTVQALRFNPKSLNTPTLLAAGSWDNTCRLWQISDNGACEPKLVQNVGAPILHVDWLEDSSKLFIASADKQARVWDLNSNTLMVVGQHDAPIQTCHWVKSYNSLMTTSWDKTIRFWDMRQLPTQTSMHTIQLQERVYAADLIQPMAVVGLSDKRVKVYRLDTAGPTEVKEIESPLRSQTRCISIFRSKISKLPTGFCLGTIEGRAAIQYPNALDPKENFTFKCHRTTEAVNGYIEIYPVNDIAFHPEHYTLVTVGGDGNYIFWDKDAKMKLKNGERAQPITKCHINSAGTIFAYALGYDWSKGHEGNTPNYHTQIFLHPIGDEMEPKKKL